jgi:type IV secretory pathway TraG/TraD family ATPase VirD4
MSRVKWGPYLLPAEAATEHFLFIGSTGSGKTVLIKMLMRSVLRPDTMNLGSRAVIYDAKQDILPFLYDVMPEERIQILHPFDKRGWAWDIAKDVTSLLAARQIATILIPEVQRPTGSDRFFNEASRELLMSAMIALMHSQRSMDWTLRDLLLLVLNPQDLSEALANTGLHVTQRVRQMYLVQADDRTRANILTSLSTSVGVHEPVAAAWHTSKKRLSIKEWIKSDKVLVLGNDESARASIDPINRALFQRISEEILHLQEQPPEDAKSGRFRTWIILDEFREAGKLEGLRRLLNKGRSKGACVVLGCQDIEGVRAVYGKEEGAELLSQCQHIAVLNVGNPETAEWATNLFGAENVAVATAGATIGSQYSETQSETTQRRTLVTTRELVSMPRISPRTGFSGYYKSPVIETSEALISRPQHQRICPWRYGDKSEFTWDRIARYLNSASGVLPFDERAKSSQYLEAWTPSERLKLGLNLLTASDERSESPPAQNSDTALCPNTPVRVPPPSRSRAEQG